MSNTIGRSSVRWLPILREQDPAERSPQIILHRQIQTEGGVRKGWLCKNNNTMQKKKKKSHAKGTTGDYTGTGVENQPENVVPPL